MGCDENISPISSDLPISIHASRMGCDGPVLRCGEHDFYFNPRIPYGMRHFAVNGLRHAIGISIHASRMGCDSPVSTSGRRPSPFQSTHPVWDATCAATLHHSVAEISIHASRMGCDAFGTSASKAQLFQSTHPVWDATTCKDNGVVFDQFQSTHPVWDATSCFRGSCGRCLFQSTHPVWDATYFPFTCFSVLSIFQSTHPVWDATNTQGQDAGAARISIHASRMGCDLNAFRDCSRHYNFNPRIPYGMRLIPAIRSSCFVTFQSTHPVWDATSCSTASARCGARFQSTHPVWDATQLESGHRNELRISIHASRMGCDQTVERLLRSRVDFNPRIPYGMRPFALIFMFLCRNFNPRIPYGMRLPSYAVQYRSN